ncbi:Gfo/Idh/MocA family protein [Anthocerotibacter panamensis]|uniref:Gfo/Idh/MocA family protein n=1 Tax=Anthocerotibacter panamensis TaxID=2857077 RepID=UPI001C407B5C|nr:Gfo/Idh/MocA family oxidoreductase [Anthocerotibacter panamensis]
MTIGVGVVGTGFGEKVHIPGFQAIPRCAVLGILGNDPARARAVALKHDIPMVFETIEAMVQHPDIQAVSVSTPPHLHYPQGLTVLRADKHLLLEKPTALNAQEAQALLMEAQQRGLVHALDFEFRMVPEWLYLKELLDRRVVGALRLVEVVWEVQGRADPCRPWNWYSEASKGGGALGAIGSHAFDYLEWLLGSLVRLSAQLTTAIVERPNSQGRFQAVDSDDTCMVMFRLADGTPGSMVLSTATWRGQGHWVRIYGEAGTLVLGSPNLADYVHGFRVWRAVPGGELLEEPIPERLQFPQSYADGRLAPFKALAERFIASIERKVPMSPSLVEGLRSQVLIDTARRAHTEGCWLAVDASSCP